MRRIALRIDDVGSAAKANEIYGKTRFTIGAISLPVPGNFLFLKYLKPFKSWGPYRELRGNEWEAYFELCEKFNVKLTIAITAGWVERSGDVIPFPEKFANEAEMIKKAVKEGMVEVANHGYSHCVLDKKKFLPRLFSGNREFHREFWDWIPADIQENHIAQSQKILESFFDEKILTFVPPGNVFSDATLAIAKKYGLKYLSCKGIDERPISHLRPIREDSVIAFHDKEMVENGLSWFSNLIDSQKDSKFVFVKEFAQLTLNG